MANKNSRDDSFNLEEVVAGKDVIIEEGADEAATLIGANKLL